MENWGLITYREASLLFNPSTDTIFNKRRVSKVVSHELAHQWVIFVAQLFHSYFYTRFFHINF